MAHVSAAAASTDAPVSPGVATGAWPAPHRIETPRLTLRCFDARDAHAVKAMFDRHRTELAAWIDLPDRPESVDATAARIARCRASFEAGEKFCYGAFVANLPELAGAMSTQPLPGRGLLAGSWMDPTLSRTGLAAEALTAMCLLAFDTGAARFIELRVRAADTATAALAERLGFTRTAADGSAWVLPRMALLESLSVRAFDALGRFLPAA